MFKNQKLKYLRFRLSDLIHEGDHTPTQSGNILFVCLFLYIYIAISLLKTLTIAFICKNIGYFRPIRLTENKTNRKSANYTHNREYELLCQFASGSCQAIKSITSDKVNVANRLKKPSFIWGLKLMLSQFRI